MFLQQVFLLGHCADNGLYLRTLATGTELHALKGHKSKVGVLLCQLWKLNTFQRCPDDTPSFTLRIPLDISLVTLDLYRCEQWQSLWIVNVQL